MRELDRRRGVDIHVRLAPPARIVVVFVFAPSPPGTIGFGCCVEKGLRREVINVGSRWRNSGESIQHQASRERSRSVQLYNRRCGGWQESEEAA